MQLNLPDHQVSIINTRFRRERDLQVRARVFDLNAKLLWEDARKASVAANAYQEVLGIPEPADATPVYFVKLELKSGQGRPISDNFYWLRSKGAGDYRSLQSLPIVPVKAACDFRNQGAERVARVKIANPTSQIAFFVQLALTQEGGAEILPVLWDDNYFSLLPGETREITARLPEGVPGKAKPRLEVGGWNVEAPFECVALSSDRVVVNSGDSVRLLATVKSTFLDGTRVPVCVDGKPVAYGWAWARGTNAQQMAVTLHLEQPGMHKLTVGSRSISVTVNP